MAPSVNRWTRALKLFWNQRATIGKETVKLVGQDHQGNKYFEAIRPNNSRPVQRYFERPKVESFDDVVDAAHVPPSWDAWLRFRRQEPPSAEEVNESEEYYRMQQEMAAQRKAKEEDEDEKTSVPKTKKQQLSDTFTGK